MLFSKIGDMQIVLTYLENIFIILQSSNAEQAISLTDI